MHIGTGSRLTELRRTSGMSQEELADRIGVSRQAVSNWERAESLPDTANLLRLAELYEITIDEIVGRESSESGGQDRGDTDVEPPARHSRLITLSWFVATTVASLAYYLVICQPLLLSTVDDVSVVFGLALGPVLAVVWFVAEVVFVLVPFLVLAAIPLRLPRGIWIAPLAAFLVPVSVVLAGDALGGAPISGYSGVGGALMSSVALKADFIALLMGCAGVVVINRRRVTLRRVGSAEPDRGQGSSI